MDIEKLKDSVKGLVFGQALGDAVGVQAEFKTKASIADYQLKYPYTKLTKDLLDIKCDFNDWTDDTDQLVLILDTIVEAENPIELVDEDVSNFARKLVDWRYHGFPELGDTSGFGMGGCTTMVTGHSEFLDDPHKVAQLIWEDSEYYMAANGGVMRTSILSVLPFVGEEDPRVMMDREPLSFYKSVQRICNATHYDPRCVISCWVQCYMCKYAILAHVTGQGIGHDRLVKLVSLLKTVSKMLLGPVYDDTKGFKRTADEDLHELCKFIDRSNDLARLALDKKPEIGYTYKCVACMVWVYRVICQSQTDKEEIDFEEIIMDVIMEGGDADTNGAVSGALLGAYLGYSGLPKDWIEGMPEKNREWLEKKVDSLFEDILY